MGAGLLLPGAVPLELTGRLQCYITVNSGQCSTPSPVQTFPGALACYITGRPLSRSSTPSPYRVPRCIGLLHYRTPPLPVQYPLPGTGRPLSRCPGALACYITGRPLSRCVPRTPSPVQDVPRCIGLLHYRTPLLLVPPSPGALQYPLPGTGRSPVHWPATLQDAPSPGAVPPPRYRTFPGALACYITGRPLSRCIGLLHYRTPPLPVQYPLPGTGRSPVHWPATLQDAPSPGAVPPPRDVPRCIGLLHYRTFPSTPSPVQDVPRCIGLLHYRTPPLPVQYPLPGTGRSPVHWPATLQDAPSPGAVPPPPPRYRTFPGALACYITGRPLSRCSTPSPVRYRTFPRCIGLLHYRTPPLPVQYPLLGTGRSPVHWHITPPPPSPGAVPPPRYRTFPGALACYITGRPLSRCSTPSPVQDVPRCIGLLHYRTPPLPVQYPLLGTGRSPVHWLATLQTPPPLSRCSTPSPVQDVPRCIGLLHYRTPPLPVQYSLPGTGRSPVHWPATLQQKAMQMCKSLDKAHQT